MGRDGTWRWLIDETLIRFIFGLSDRSVGNNQLHDLLWTYMRSTNPHTVLSNATLRKSPHLSHKRPPYSTASAWNVHLLRVAKELAKSHVLVDAARRFVATAICV